MSCNNISVQEARKYAREFFDRLERAENILDGFYGECDEDGHLKPDVDSGYCEHCFRRLEYKIDLDAILVRNSNFSLCPQRMDASLIAEERERKISLQKFMDRLGGIEHVVKKFDL